MDMVVAFARILLAHILAAVTGSRTDDLIEKTMWQIRQLVDEIVELARQDVDVREFYQGFLDRVISCLAAAGGAVWTLDNAHNLKLVHSMNLPDVLSTGPSQSLRCHDMLLKKALADGKGALVEAHWGEADGDQPRNPTDWLLVLGVLKTDRNPTGIVIRSDRLTAGWGGPHIDQYPTGLVEIFQRPGAPPTTQRGYLKFVREMSEIASRYLQRHQ